MRTVEEENSLKYWNDFFKSFTREDIQVDDWLADFDEVIEKCQTPILDLGSGRGNDTLYLINKGKKVIASDQSINSINNIKRNIPEVYDTKCFNLLDGIPFDDQSFDIIVGDLCLHYFREQDTVKIIKDIRRVLTNNGHLMIRLNSINDTNFGAGQGIEVEHHLYQTDDRRLKRFFDEEDIKYFFKDFELEYVNEEIMTRYNLEKRLYKCLVKK